MVCSTKLCLQGHEPLLTHGRELVEEGHRVQHPVVDEGQGSLLVNGLNLNMEENT